MRAKLSFTIAILLRQYCIRKIFIRRPPNRAPKKSCNKIVAQRTIGVYTVYILLISKLFQFSTTTVNSLTFKENSLKWRVKDKFTPTPLSWEQASNSTTKTDQGRRLWKQPWLLMRLLHHTTTLLISKGREGLLSIPLVHYHWLVVSANSGLHMKRSAK